MEDKKFFKFMEPEPSRTYEPIKETPKTFSIEAPTEKPQFEEFKGIINTSAAIRRRTGVMGHIVRRAKAGDIVSVIGLTEDTQGAAWYILEDDLYIQVDFVDKP